MDGPKQTTVASNIEWFNDNEHYMAAQSRLECYQNIQRIVERELRGVDKLLDVGNGGFFNYDTALVAHVTAVDLFLKEGPGPFPNSSFRTGSLLQLPCPDQAFDCILEQNVFHHVTGRNVRENHANLEQCLHEMHRCLKPGGKAVIIESTVGPIFYAFERLVFRAALFVKRGGHPVTFQFTPRQIIRAGQACGFVVEEFTYVPRGAFVLQFGYKWPSLLTPAKPIKLILRRPECAQTACQAA
jgi:SAM-dependent methyltransferase